MSPFIVYPVEPLRKLVHVRDDKEVSVTPFNIFQFKKYVEPEMLSKTFIVELDTYLRKLPMSRNQPPTNGVYDASFLTEMISLQDPRAKSPEMKAAIAKKVKGLMDTGTFKVILQEKIPPDANFLPGSFFLAIKSTKDSEVK